MSHKILIILTSHDILGKTGEKTGFWLEEFTTPFYDLLDAGADITLASIKGGAAPIDPKSSAASNQTESTRRFEKDQNAQKQLANTIAIDMINPDEYDAVFLPGGHGTMWDFPNSATLKNTLEAFASKEKIIAAVCHAPAALVSLTNPDGSPLVAGKSLTSFTNNEERAAALEEIVPFLLQSKLIQLGATFHGGENFKPNVVRDGLLITGQNPASSAPVADALLNALNETASA